MRGIPYVLAFFCGAIAIVQIHLALGEGPQQEAVFRLALWVLGLGCTISFVMRNREQQWVAARLGEQIGVWVLTLSLFATSCLIGLGYLDWQIEGWQLFLVFLSLSSFLLQSQNSFIILGVTSGVVLLIAQSLRPWVVATVFYVISFLGLLGSQAMLERGERFRSRLGSSDRGVWLKATAAVAGCLLFLLFGIYRFKPPARATTPGELAQNWRREFDRMAGRGPAGNQPGNISASGSGGGWPGSHERQTFHFERDLKFGDHDPWVEQRPNLYLRLRSEDGSVLRPDETLLYLTMSVAADYDGRAWVGDRERPRLLEGGSGGVSFEAPQRGRIVEQQYVLLPFKKPVLIGMHPVTRVMLPALKVDREGSLLRTRAQAVPVKYRLLSRIYRPTPQELGRTGVRSPAPRYLAYPKKMLRDPYFSQMMRLAGRVGRPYWRVRWILGQLRSYRYTLRPAFDKLKDPTLEFLRFRRGYCQHFCSAMALVLRAVGVPTRIVIGYAGGDWNSKGQHYVVRSSHVHAWVQVHFEKYGWVSFDPAQSPVRSFLDSLENPGPEDPRPEDPRPEDPRPEDPRPEDPRPEDPRPEDPRPEDPRPEDPRPEDPRPEDPRPEDPRPEDPRPGDPRPGDPRPEDPRPGDPRPEDPRPEDPRPEDPRPEDPEQDDSLFDTYWQSARSPAVVEPDEAEGPAAEPTAGQPEQPGLPLWPSWWELLSLRQLGRIFLVAGLIGLWWFVGGWIRGRPRRHPVLAPELVTPPGPPCRYRTRGTIEFEVVVLTVDLLETLGPCGYPHEPSQALAEYVDSLPDRFDLRPLLDLFNRARYGFDALEPADLERARHAVAEIEADL